MPYIRDRVFVLKREPFGEADRRYTVYGREHGLMTVVARGTSRLHSKQAGHLEPFCVSDVMIAHGRAFDTLAVARVVPGDRQSRLAGLAILGAFSDLVVSLTRPGISDHRIFDLLNELRRACGGMENEPSPERARLLYAGATLKLLDYLGFAPSFDDSQKTKTPQAALLFFMRRAELTDLLRVTASADVFVAVANTVEESLQHTPLERAPHGPATLDALLRSGV